MKKIALMYHRIEKSNDARVSQFSRFYNQRQTLITLENFIRDIKYLLELGWKHVPIEKINESEDKSFHISFDDGYKEIISLVVPTLLKFHINNASFYVSTSTISENYLPLPLDVLYYLAEKGRYNSILKILQIKKGNSMASSYYIVRKKLYNMTNKEIFNFISSLNLSLKDKQAIKLQYLTLQDIKKIKSLGFTMGSHGTIHRNYCLNRNDTLNDLVESKNFLEKILVENVNSFSFPDGVYNEELIKLCTNIGYKYLLAISKNNKNDLVIPRAFITNKGVKEYV